MASRRRVVAGVDESGRSVVRSDEAAPRFVVLETIGGCSNSAIWLDDGEVHLGTGDHLVQQATWHAWHNRGREPCVLVGTMFGLP